MAFSDDSVRWVARVTGDWRALLASRRAALTAQLIDKERELAELDDADALTARSTKAKVNLERLAQALAQTERERAELTAQVREALRERIARTLPICRRVAAAREVDEARALLRGLEAQFGLALLGATPGEAAVRFRTLAQPLAELHRRLQARVDAVATQLQASPEQTLALDAAERELQAAKARQDALISDLVAGHSVSSEVLDRVRALSDTQLDSARQDLIEPLLADCATEAAYGLDLDVLQLGKAAP